MAAEYAFHTEVETFQGAVFAESLQCILRARGRESARGRFERRDAQLIEFYQQDERRGKYLLQAHLFQLFQYLPDQGVDIGISQYI